MKFIRWLLFPVSQLYVLVTAIRNFLFDIGFYRQDEFPVIVISVGNLSTGGTGKTPFVEYLAQLISTHKRVAVLSRGYGRHTKGFVLADDEATPESIGDEPFQIYTKFKEAVVVAVCEKRSVGISNLLELKEKPQVILLDDAYQHRWVKRDLNILLTTFKRPFFRDLVLPTGNLRETRFEAKRADLVVVTKSPVIGSKEKDFYSRRIHRLSRGANVLFSNIEYGNLKAVFKKESLKSEQVVLLTGIANAEHFSNYISKTHLVAKHFEYPDHHGFTASELDRLNVKLSENDYPIITTEKDMVRLLAFQDHELFKQHALFYLPISLAFDNTQTLDDQIMNLLTLRKSKSN